MKIENPFYCLEIDPQHGTISRLFDKAGGLELLVEPRLADNFRLLLPLPDQQANYILGKEQRLTGVEEKAGGVVLHWDGPLANPQGAFDLDVTMRIEFAEEAIQFRLEVHNRTSFQVAEVWYPLLGGLTGIGERQETQVMIPRAGWSWELNLLQNFKGLVELGTPVPEYFFPYPGNMPMPWMDIFNPGLNRGVYLACCDPIPRFKVLRLEMQPGIAHGRQDPWPRPEELGEGIAAGLILNWVSFPYTLPGETFKGPPVILQFHQGDWHEAALIYRQWFTANFSRGEPLQGWMRRELAFQNAMLLLPEGNINLKFKEVPQWAQEALDYGVKSVLISGWDRGGHDNQYPYYEPDPRLGTWDELAAAIRQCHQLGIKVFFFVNLQPVDCTTEWYRTELHRYRSMDPWGCSVPVGWGMGTLGARMGITRRPMVKASPSFPQFRQLIVRQVKRLAEIGADGVHIDKLAWASPGIDLDFNPELEVSPDQASWEGILRGVEEILASCRAVNPEFCVSVEGPWDRLLQYAAVAWVWHSTWERDHTAAFKFTFPQWLPTLAVTQPYDYQVVNNAMRFGYQLFVGPAHYTASMHWEPMRPLSAYIREVLRIREALKETLFLGEFLDTLQVRVEGHEEIRFNTHLNPKTGKRACVLVNLGEVSREVSVAFEGKSSELASIYQPFEKRRSEQLPVALAIPPERLAIVVEE